MRDNSIPPGKPYVYAFSSGRLVLLVCMVLALMAFSLMLGIRIERYQEGSGRIAVRNAKLRPTVQTPAEPSKASAEAEVPASPSILSGPETPLPGPISTATETAEPSKSPLASEPVAPEKAVAEAPAPPPVKASPKPETPAAPQKAIAASPKPEAKPTSTAQSAAAAVAASPAAQPKPKAAVPVQQPKPAAEVAVSAAPAKKPETTTISQKEGSKGRFAVQISASQDKSIANSQAEQLKRKGFTTYIEQTEVPGKGRFYRVLVGPFPTEVEAGQVRGQIVKDSSFAGCYVRAVP